MPAVSHDLVNRRILVVDDQEAIHADFQKILSPSGSSDLDDMISSLFGDTDGGEAAPGLAFPLFSALQGKDALDLVREAHERDEPYAVAFVDMRMPPGWDGLRTVRELWNVDPRIEIVICTAYSDRSWQELAQIEGQEDKLLLLKKPFDPAEVHQLARALTEKWNATRVAAWKMEELDQLVTLRTGELEAAMHHKTDFLALLNHEFRTPLNGVLGYAELLGLENFGPLTPEQHRALDQITSSGQHLLEIFRDIMDVVASASGSIKLARAHFAVGEWARKIAATFAETDGRITPAVDVVDEAATVWADTRRCAQVLSNLLDNANKHTPPTGSITMRVGPTAGGFVRIAVTDTGCGIPQEELPRLFSQFGKTTRSVAEQTGGTGIGLALSRRIVELHGGEIGVESIPHTATTFWFTLPGARS